MEYLILQLEEPRIRVARFNLSRGTATLAGAADFEFGPDQSLTAALATIAAGITGAPRIILCLAPELFARRVIELPLRDRRKAREVLPAVLQGEIAIPVEELLLDCLPVGEGRYLAMWARKTEIARYLELFCQAGIEPQMISCAPLCWPYLPGLPNSCAVSDGGALAVIQDGQTVFLRTFAGDDVSQIAATLSAWELSGGVRPERVFMLGELDQAATDCSQIEPLPAPEDQGLLFRNQAAFDQLASLYAVARATEAGAAPDFRRGELAWTSGDQKVRGKLFLTAALIIAVAVLLLVAKGVQYRSAQKDLVSLNTSIAMIYHEIFPARPKAVDELSEIKGELRKLSGTDGSVSFLDLLRQLAEAKGNTITGLYETELEGNTVRLKGDARSAQAVNEFKAALAKMMATVELGEIKSRPDGSVTFSLTGVLMEVKK